MAGAPCRSTRGSWCGASYRSSSSPSCSAADRVFRGERDKRLLAALTELHNTRSTERIDVAIVYGAAHVGDLVHALASTLGYRPRSADWLTVLDE